MKYISIDIETTGPEPKYDQILQIAAVVEDTDNPWVPVTKLPTWECLIRYDRYHGNGTALGMNIEIIRALSETQRFHSPIRLRGRDIQVFEDNHNARLELKKFLLGNSENDRAIVAGKNAAGFDLQFLGPVIRNVCYHRVIDPGSVALGSHPNDWWNGPPPSQAQLVPDHAVSHDALDDALDVIVILRRLTGLYGRGLYGRRG
jgi:oligoribonuclease (3'-5' exoribonuclease)